MTWKLDATRHRQRTMAKINWQLINNENEKEKNAHSAQSLSLSNIIIYCNYVFMNCNECAIEYAARHHLCVCVCMCSSWNIYCKVIECIINYFYFHMEHGWFRGVSNKRCAVDTFSLFLIAFKHFLFFQIHLRWANKITI